MLCAPVVCGAQNVWEMKDRPQQKALFNKKDRSKDIPYLRGAVPEVDGKVQFDTIVALPGKTRQQIYDAALEYLTLQTTEEGQIDNLSRVMYQKPENGDLAARYTEWLVFKNKALELDRTRFNYQIVAQCSDGSVKISIRNISYDYDEERTPIHYTAEEWISDEYAVNKKNTKLLPVSAKFRRKTVDRVKYIFETMASDLQK